VGPGIGLGGAPAGEHRSRPAPRWAEGAVVGLAAAGVVAGAWWGVVALTKSQFVLLAVAVGFVVGQAVVIGARRGSLGLGVYAAAITLAALAVAEYFIQRTLAIQEVKADIPLWQGWDFAVDVVRTSLEDQPSSFLFWGIAAVVAGVQAAKSNAKPAL
jgi:hypothetical protein